MQFSLRQRVLAGIGVVLSLMTLLSAGLDAGRAQDERRQALETRLHLVATMQARTLAQAVWDFNAAQIQAVLNSLAEDPDFAFAEILDDKDKPIAKRETSDLRLREAHQLTTDEPIDFQDGSVKKTIGHLRYSLSELRLEQANRTQLQLNAGAAVLILAVTLAAVYAVFRTINGPLVAMTAAMTQLARGDQTTIVPAQHRRDEIGDMARAVVVFKNNAQAMVRMDAERKAADMNNETQRRAGLANVADELDGTIGSIVANLQSAANDMEQGVKVLGATAREADVASATVTDASRQASANVQIIADAATQWSASISEVASQSERSVEIAQRASDDAMRATKAIGGMTEAAQRIGEAVDLIAAISAQTNLLALNATIEAARAGEAGRGFTVVATEVKALAARTNGAVESISQQIAAISSVSSNAASEVMTIAKVIGEMTGLSATVASSIEKQTATTAEIVRSAKAAAERVVELDRSLAVLTVAAARTDKACTGFEGSATVVADGVRQLASEAAEFGRRIRAG